MSVPAIDISLTDILTDADDFEHQPLLSDSKYYDIASLKTIQNLSNPLKNLSIFNSNARSLLKHETEYKTLFDQAHNSGLNFDILTFCETWLDDNLANLVSFENYSPIFKHKSPSKEGGGIAVFLRNSLNYKVRHDLSFESEFCDKFDGIFIELNSECTRENIVLCIIYRSPSFNSTRDNDDKLSQTIDIVKNENKNIIITGDLNIDLLKYLKHSETTNFLDHMLLRNLIPKITRPTRITQNSSTLIDHIYTDIDKTKCIAGTLMTDITDHFSNFIILNCSHKRYQPQIITYRVINDKLIDNLNRDLENTDWNAVYNSHDVDTAYKEFEQKFSELVNKHLPVKSKKFNKYKHRKEPWITKGILVSMKTKEKLYIIMIKSRKSPTFKYNEQAYKTYNSIYNKCLRMAKNIHWKATFHETKNDSKKTWENIDILLNRNKAKASPPAVFSDHSRTYTTHTEIAQGFNNYFTKIGPSLAANIPHTQKSADQLLPPFSIPNSLFFTPTTPNEIFNILNSMKAKTSCGHDGLSPKLVKQCSANILTPLTHIVNLSMSTGHFPQEMKIAKVVAIYKKDNPASLENYRPISLLPTFSKILERTVYNRLYSFLQYNNILTPSQYGFRKKLSTEYAILELHDRIVQCIANREWCIGIFLDLSKAFDTLDHRILISKLKHIGIRGIALNWFHSYLSNRKQFTSFQNSHSQSNNLECGVPQGSILGPLLFLIYINDITHNLKYSKAILFADDTNLLINEHNFSKLIENVNQELSVIKTWFDSNKLSLNIAKTTYIIFHLPQKKIPSSIIDIKIGQTNIKQTSHAKFLGVHIDENLNWKKHITTKANQVLKTSAILARLKHSIPTDTLRTIYNALILPQISYAIIAWGNIKNREMTRLKTLQKRAIRTITKAKYNSHTSPLFKKTKSLRLEDIYRLECTKFFIKSRNGVLPSYFSNQFITNSQIHNYNTRHLQDLHGTVIRSTIENQLINSKISGVWNNLPEISRNSITSISSVTNLKEYILSTYQDNCTIPNCYICSQ
jgi:exonuclease III